MKRRMTKSRLWIAVLMMAAFAAALTARASFGGSTSAAILPGTVPQTATSQSAGLALTLQMAVFSGSGVDITMSVRSEDPLLSVVGIQPDDAMLAGIRGSSAQSSRAGVTTVRFPAESWEPTRSTAELFIRAVQVSGSGGRPLQRITGDWNLLVQLPNGDDAAAARAVHALKPVLVDVAGHDVLVEGFRTSNATVIRYQLTDGTFSLRPPSLRFGETVIQARQIEQASRDVPAVAWFGITPPDTPLTVIFGDLRVPDPDATGWRLNLALGSVDPVKRPERGEQPAILSMNWVRLDESTGPDIHAVELVMLPEGSGAPDQINLLLEGIWDPGPPSPGDQMERPTVMADGASLRVSGFGGYFETSDRGPLTAITADLIGSIPQTLEVGVTSETIALDPIEVALQP